jgi:hypothetical protein
MLKTHRAEVVGRGLGLAAVLLIWELGPPIARQKLPPNTTDRNVSGRHQQPVPSRADRVGRTVGEPKDFADAISLPASRGIQKRLHAAEEFIQSEVWGTATYLLRSILESKEDVFVQIRRKGIDGQEILHWASARSEANRLLGSMPQKGQEFYQFQYGAQGMALLEEAKRKNDPQLLAEVALMFFHTDAGVEATRLLGTYHLDRGRPLMAALCFERVLESERVNQLPPLAYLEATLAYHLSGDQANAQRMLKHLAVKMRPEGIRVGEQTITLRQFRRELKWMVSDEANPFDWPVFRGSTSKPGAPFLDKTWQRPTVRDPIGTKGIDSNGMK